MTRCVQVIVDPHTQVVSLVRLRIFRISRRSRAWGADAPSRCSYRQERSRQRSARFRKSCSVSCTQSIEDTPTEALPPWAPRRSVPLTCALPSRGQTSIARPSPSRDRSSAACPRDFRALVAKGATHGGKAALRPMDGVDANERPSLRGPDPRQLAITPRRRMRSGSRGVGVVGSIRPRSAGVIRPLPPMGWESMRTRAASESPGPLAGVDGS
jgi:hypothetical protein